MALNEDSGDDVATLTDNFLLVGNRGEAEDLKQKAFLKLYRHALGKRPFAKRSFDAGCAAEQNISAWLYRVAMNLDYDALRSRSRGAFLAAICRGGSRTAPTWR